VAEFAIRFGCRSAQGLRSNNEDSFLADPENQLFVVADGMGGQECGERASGMAVEILPRALSARLADCAEPVEAVVAAALEEANQAIIDAGREQTEGRRMGTTAVLALQQADRVYVAGLGDSRAYLIRGDRVEQLTHDHTVAEALVRSGTITPEQGLVSPWRHVLYKFLGCAEMTEGADVYPFTPQAGDLLVLATDGMTNHVEPEDLVEGAVTFTDPQDWADHLVNLALARGSQDNVTVLVVAFHAKAQRLRPPSGGHLVQGLQ
jgi:serine/threonine protein phosphatase PrpC